MKKTFISPIFIFSLLTIGSYESLRAADTNSTLVYSLPKTELVVEIEVEKTTQKPGQYYQYSERYLATNQAITESKTTYRLKDINVKWHSIPDTKRSYPVTVEPKSNMKLLTVNSQGLLCGINVPVQQIPNEDNSQKIITQNKTSEIQLLPLGEEYLLAGSNSKLAEGVAKQIYRIRESRVSIITGDLEHFPADGSSLKTMLDELNQMEKQLTELFTGKTTIEVIKQSVTIQPDAEMSNRVIFRLSALKGIVPADDLSGNPIYISITPEKTNLPKTESKAANSGLNTVLPATTDILISDGTTALYSNKILIPQLGPVVTYPLELFNSPSSKVYVDVESGKLLRIEK